MSYVKLPPMRRASDVLVYQCEEGHEHSELVFEVSMNAGEHELWSQVVTMMPLDEFTPEHEQFYFDQAEQDILRRYAQLN